MHQYRTNKCIGLISAMRLASGQRLLRRNINGPHRYCTNPRRFSSSDGVPASHRACAGRCGDRLECDRAERDRGPSQFDPAIARARDCSRRDLRRGARRRPEECSAYAVDVEAPAGTSVEAAVVAAAHGTPGAARACGAVHAGRGPERQPVQDRRRARQDRRDRARRANR